MARAKGKAVVSQSVRVSNQISLGLLAKTIPVERIKSVLSARGKMSQRLRDLPAQVMVYYVIAMALYMEEAYREILRRLVEGLAWLLGPEEQAQVAGKAAISRARARLGWEVLRDLYEQLVQPIAEQKTRGAWYRKWRLVSLDGSTLDVADTAENEQAFGRPGASRGRSAYPQLRFVALVENGTHVLFGSQLGAYATGETTLAQNVVRALQKGMLCLADRLFFSFRRWDQARGSGADLLWRVKKNMRLPCEKRLADGSYWSRVFPSQGDQRRNRNGLLVRVIEYRLEGVAGAEAIYRLLTTILDPEQAPAAELAALYHDRWEIETVLDELKTHLRGSKIVLRSKTPDLVRQEFWGLLLAHFAIRGLMHEAALLANEDPDRLSFLHAVRVVRRKLPLFVAIPPSAENGLPSTRAPGNSRTAGGVKPQPAQLPLRETQDEQLPSSAGLRQDAATCSC